eukprot:gene11133-12304_t
MKQAIAILLFFTGVLCQATLDDQYKSVLDYPRIHFSGRYIVNAATVNNIYDNYNTDEFLDHHALPNNEGGKGGWNPYGTNDFLLQNVTIRTVCYKDGMCTGNRLKDSAIDKSIQDFGFQTPSKMVDLDPQAQQYTQIWALQLKVPGLFQAKVDVLTMQRHWQNAIFLNPKNDYSLSGTFQGVLTDVIWDLNKDSSEIIKQFKSEMERLGSRKLSIKFVLDTFLIRAMNGRIYGTIGMQGIKSSTTSLLERLIISRNNTLYQDPSFKLGNNLRKIVMDLGSCFPIHKDGTLLSQADEHFVVAYPNSPMSASNSLTCRDSFTILAKVPLEKENWLENEAGYLTIDLTRNQVKLLQYRPLILLKLIYIAMTSSVEISLKRDVKGQRSDTTCMEIIAKECSDGIVLRPMGQFLFRMDSGESFTVTLGAKQFGEPIGNLEIGLFLIKNSSVYYCCWPAFPLPDGLVTNRDGIVTVNVTTPMLRNPRKFLDGQAYGIAYYPKNTCLGKKISGTAVGGEYVIPLKVYGYEEHPNEVTWVDHIYPIFKQYTNLYPIMKHPTIDLSNYHSVVSMKKKISLSMNLPENHSSYMPVTRDMSKRRRRMITTWLEAEKPKLGDVNKLITVQHLRKLVQAALEVEHSTIPPYMTALWSIRDGLNRQVHRLIQTIIRQEMLHMGLAANLLNAIGGKPSFIHSSFIPKYPTPLPGGLSPDLIVSLEKLSPRVIRDVFMKIEKPDLSPTDATFRKLIFSQVKAMILQDFCTKKGNNTDAQCRHFLKTHTSKGFSMSNGCPKAIRDFFERSTNTDDSNKVNFKSGIAAFYTHILYAIAKLTDCGANNDIFSGDPERQITTDSYNYGNGKLFKVTDYVSAVNAIMTIIEEGEGTSECDPAVHYFQAQDDLSHYTMFHSIVRQRRVNIKNRPKKGIEGYYNSTWQECDITEKPYEFSGKKIQYIPQATWPIIKNAKATDYKVGSLSRVQSKVFARLYNRLLGSLHKAFNGEKEFFINARFLMYAVDYYGRTIVKMPIKSGSSPLSGPNAAPVFTWIKTEVENLRGIKKATNRYASLKVAKKLYEKELSRKLAKPDGKHVVKTKRPKVRKLKIKSKRLRNKRIHRYMHHLRRNKETQKNRSWQSLFMQKELARNEQKYVNDDEPRNGEGRYDNDNRNEIRSDLERDEEA